MGGHLFGRALEVVYSTTQVWAGLPYICAAAGVFSGGIVVWTLFMWVFEYVTMGREKRWFKVSAGAEKGKKLWVSPGYTPGKNYWHLFLNCVFFIGIVFIVWIAAAVAGLNPWTSAAATLAVSVIITYSFAGVLGHLSSGAIVLASNSIGIGQYWEFANYPGYEGFVHAIDKVSVTLTRKDPESQATEVIYIPMSMFTNNPRKRNFQKEMYEKKGLQDEDDIPPEYRTRRKAKELGIKTRLTMEKMV